MHWAWILPSWLHMVMIWTHSRIHLFLFIFASLSTVPRWIWSLWICIRFWISYEQTQSSRLIIHRAQLNWHCDYLDACFHLSLFVFVSLSTAPRWILGFQVSRFFRALQNPLIATKKASFTQSFKRLLRGFTSHKVQSWDVWPSGVCISPTKSCFTMVCL